MNRGDHVLKFSSDALQSAQAVASDSATLVAGEVADAAAASPNAAAAQSPMHGTAQSPASDAAAVSEGCPPRPSTAAANSKHTNNRKAH